MFTYSLSKDFSTIKEYKSSEKRLLKELGDIANNIDNKDKNYYNIEYYKWSVTLLENNLYNWRLCIKGEANTIYENGTFFLDIRFPKDYPFKLMFQNCLFLLNSLV